MLVIFAKLFEDWFVFGDSNVINPLFKGDVKFNGTMIRYNLEYK